MRSGSRMVVLSRLIENLRDYLLSVPIVLLALAASASLSSVLGTAAPYILVPAVAAAASHYLGLGPATLTLTLTLLGIQFGSGLVPNHSPAIGPTILLVLVSTALIAMEEFSRRRILQLANHHEELEDRVRERTAELDAANQSLRELSGRLLHLQDEERRRIARELHDSVGQLLVSLSLNLSKARTGIERLREESSVLADSEALVEEVSKEVRTISHLLHPPLLDEAGLSSAIEWYVDGFARRSNIQVDLDIPRDLGRLSREIETAIFRVVQESLTNIHRHSGSSRAKVRLHRDEGQVFIEVEDAGKGIVPEKLEKINSIGTSGVGIRGMRERVRQLGGEIELHSSAKGTVLMAALPVDESPSIESAVKLPDKSTPAAA